MMGEGLFCRFKPGKGNNLVNSKRKQNKKMNYQKEDIILVNLFSLVLL